MIDDKYLSYLSATHGVTFVTMFIRGEKVSTLYTRAGLQWDLKTSPTIYSLLVHLKKTKVMTEESIRDFSVTFPEVEYLGPLGGCHLFNFRRFVESHGCEGQKHYAEVAEGDGTVIKTIDGVAVTEGTSFWARWDDLLLADKQYLNCIKAYRASFGVMLKEARDAVDARKEKLLKS